MTNEITLRALKYDRSPHLEWRAELVQQRASRPVCLVCPGTVCRHHGKGIEFVIDHHVLCVFEPGAWFNTMLDFDDQGRRLEIYCNVAIPFALEAGYLSWVDLDLDVVLSPGTDAFLADEDEFVENVVNFGYPGAVIDRVRATASLLLERDDRRAYPFEWLTFDAALAGLQVPRSAVADLPRD